MMSNELLEMRLHDISDLLLQEMCERGSRECVATLPGTDGDGERVKLTVSLEYEELEESYE